jgi:hypothetical protein
MWYAIWQYVIKPENASVIQAFSGAASAIFALTLIWTTVCQIRIYHRMRIDGVHRDRASIFINKFICASGHTVGMSPRDKAMFWDISVEWENTGHTQTMGMINFVNVIWFANGDIPTTFEYPDFSDVMPVQRPTIVLGPKQSIYAQAVRIFVGKLDASKRGEGNYYIYGWTEYRDVFKRATVHRTEFCRQVTALGMPDDPTCGFLFTTRGPFNSAEKDCYRKAGKEPPVCKPGDFVVK